MVERRSDPRSRTAGRRWADDPELRTHFEHLMVGISRDLHALRERQGWSIDQAGLVAGVDPQTVLDVEKTRGDPRLSTLMRLFFIYGQQLVVAGRPVPQTRL